MKTNSKFKKDYTFSQKKNRTYIAEPAMRIMQTLIPYYHEIATINCDVTFSFNQQSPQDCFRHFTV